MIKTIDTKNAPAAVGPYVHAIQAGNTVYTSGQLGLIPETGELILGENVYNQGMSCEVCKYE